MILADRSMYPDISTAVCIVCVLIYIINYLMPELYLMVVSRPFDENNFYPSFYMHSNVAIRKNL